MFILYLGWTRFHKDTYPQRTKEAYFLPRVYNVSA